MKKTVLASVIAAACANAYAIEPFTPLNAPAALDNSWDVAPGWQATKLIDRNTMESYYGTGAGAQPGGEFQDTFGNWDMLDVSADGRHIYLPYEVRTGAGVTRYDRFTGESVTLMGGNATGVFETNPASWSADNDDFGAFDPAVLTPSGSLVVGEEWSGNGRLFEVLNPRTAANKSNANARWLSNIPSVSHEGVRFDSNGSMYFVDENNSGSIYRMTPNTAGDYSSGKVEVLVDSDGVHNAAAGYWDAANQAAGARTGAASWVEMVDTAGNPTTTTSNPFDFTSRGGRAAADELEGTPYGRPEDAVIGTVNDQEILYFATTSENILYGVNLTTDEVFEAINSDVTPDTLGNNPVGAGAGDDATYGLDDPDNVEVTYGPNGELQLWAIEDEGPGDIWMGQDNDADGIMDEVSLFASNGFEGSEPTGLRVDPLTGGFLVNVQHPADGNDSLWAITPAPAPVPVPAAAWLFGSALLGLVGAARRKRA